MEIETPRQLLCVSCAIYGGQGWVREPKMWVRDRVLGSAGFCKKKKKRNERKNWGRYKQTGKSYLEVVDGMGWLETQE